jgi:hypothetical protein
MESNDGMIWAVFASTSRNVWRLLLSKREVEWCLLRFFITSALDECLLLLMSEGFQWNDKPMIANVFLSFYFLPVTFCCL